MKKILYFSLLLLISNFSIKAQNWEQVGNGAKTGLGTSPPKIFADTVHNLLLGANQTLDVNNNVVNGMAKFVNGEWVQFDTNLIVPVHEMAIHKNQLFVSSTMPEIDDSTKIARWDNPGWTIIGKSYEAFIGDMQSINDSLYITGWVGSMDGTSLNRIGRWLNPGWSPVGPHSFYLFFQMHTMAYYKDELYVGGNFINEGTTCCVSRWNGENWNPIAEGIVVDITIDLAVTKLIVYKDELYILGTFDHDSLNTRYILRWDGEKLKDVGGGLNSTALDAAVFNGELYVVGGYSKAGGINAKNIAKWDGERWCSLGSEFDGPIYDIEILNDEIYISGSFKNIDGIPAKGIARWIGGDYVDTCGAIVSAIEPEIAEKSFDIFPNPARHELHISITGDFQNQPISLTIFNILGERLFEQRGFDPSEAVDVSGLSSGTYILQLRSGEGVIARKFVVQR